MDFYNRLQKLKNELTEDYDIDENAINKNELLEEYMLRVLRPLSSIMPYKYKKYLGKYPPIKNSPNMNANLIQGLFNYNNDPVMSSQGLEDIISPKKPSILKRQKNYYEPEWSSIIEAYEEEFNK